MRRLEGPYIEHVTKLLRPRTKQRQRRGNLQYHIKKESNGCKDRENEMVESKVSAIKGEGQSTMDGDVTCFHRGELGRPYKCLFQNCVQIALQILLQ